MRLVLAAASIGTALVVAWLTVVIAVVLPARSPASVPTWIAIDALAIALVAASGAWLARPSRSVAWATRILAVAVAVVGGWLVGAWLQTPSGQPGEGYLLLVGGWLLIHGSVAVLAAGRSVAPSRTAS